MIDRRDLSIILHEQWIAVLEGNEEELPTVADEVHIGSDGNLLWASISVNDDPEWDDERISIPTGLARLEADEEGANVRIVTGIEAIGLFNQFVCELILGFHRGLNATDAIASAIKEIRARIAAWREPMSSRKQRGLIGELTILNRLIVEFGDSAMEYWVGPTCTYDSIHDFVGSSLHIEVKATTTVPPVVHINDIEQLDWRGDFELLLGVIHIIDNAQGGTLHEHISDTSDALETESSKLRFSHLCSFTGYNPDHRYELRHVVQSVRFFEINQDSSILQPDRFSDIPRNILSLKYSLAVNTLDEVAEDDIGWFGFTQSG